MSHESYGEMGKLGLSVSLAGSLISIITLGSAQSIVSISAGLFAMVASGFAIRYYSKATKKIE